MPNENTDSQVNIARIMIPKISVAAVHANDTVRQGLEIMKYHRYTSIPVLDGQDVYLGSVTEGDFLRHILATGTTEMKAHEKYRISEIFRQLLRAAADIRFPAGAYLALAGTELRTDSGRQGLPVRYSHTPRTDTPSQPYHHQ